MFKHVLDLIDCKFLISPLSFLVLSQDLYFLFSPPLLLFRCQGYPQALLPLTVAGIPSIHICLDFIPELLAQPQLEKQVRPRNLPFPLFPFFWL